MEPRSQRWLKTSTISRPRRESCSGSLSSRLSSRASISSWTRAAAVLTPHRHSPLAGGQAQPQGRVGLAGAAGAYGDDVVTARGEPPGKRTPCAPLCRPDGPADLPDVPNTGRQAKSVYAALRAKPGQPSRRPGGSRRGATGRGSPRGETPLLRAPCAGLTAPQHSRTSKTTGRAAKRLYAALRAKPGHPGKDRRGATGR